MAHSVVDADRIERECRKNEKTERESLLWQEQKCRHCFIRAGTVPNEVNLTRCVHQNRLNSFTELYTVVCLYCCCFSPAFFVLLFETDSLAEHSVYRLLFNTLSPTISSSLFWSAGVDFCVCLCWVNVPKQTHLHMHLHMLTHAPLENITLHRVR